MSKIIGTIENGAPVIDRSHSHVHYEYGSTLLEYIKVALQHISTSTDQNIPYTHSFTEVIGDSICVPTDDTDEIVYAKRRGRSGYTRFVKSREPIPTQKLTVVLKRDQKVSHEQYVLITAYIGEKAPPEPWDFHADDKARMFWDSHALVWGKVEVIPGTETSECPW